MAVPADYLRAARRYGPQLDDVASQYRNPITGRPLSGTALLLKLGKGESGYNPNAVSGAGARGYTQFMPDTRKQAIEKYGVDPWRSADEAVKAAVLHLQGKLGPGIEGLASYNPGDAGYESYILGQHVGSPGGSRATAGAAPKVQLDEQGRVQNTSTTQTQLPGAAQLDLAGLLARIGPKQNPMPMGVAAPAFSAGQQFQSLPGTARPAAQDQTGTLASILASANLGPSTITNTQTTQGGAPGGAQSSKMGGGHGGGLATFDGKKVAAWMVPVLRYARARGWKGTITSGYRSDAEQTRIYKSGVRPAAVPKSMGGAGSNHERTGFLQGAIDVTDAQTLNQILQRKHSRLQWAGPRDAVHFSVPRNGTY